MRNARLTNAAHRLSISLDFYKKEVERLKLIIKELEDKLKKA